MEPAVNSAPYFTNSPTICAEKTIPVNKSVRKTIGNEFTPKSKHCLQVSYNFILLIFFKVSIKSNIVAPICAITFNEYLPIFSRKDKFIHLSE